MFPRATFVFLLFTCIESLYGIDIRKCPHLPYPDNGYVVCDHLIGAFCAPVCNPGYTHETQPAQAYVCNPARKAWGTYPAGYPLPWPNCIKSSVRSIVRSESAIKKSLVDQQTPQPVPASQGGGGQSLWQRMLKLTSELTQSKMKDVTGGAARSVQSIVGNKNANTNSNNNIYKTDVTKDSSNSNKNTANVYNNINGVSTNSYYGNSLYATPTPLYYSGASMDDPEVRDLHFRRLKEYWDAYYKRFYESLGPGKLPDWMSRSPWSNDPERVQGALDKDVVGNGDQPNSTTSLQNWNSYFQDYFAYPSPPSSYTNRTDIDNSTNSRPNSSSDAFIENVIENDLEARNISDKTINRDLYYEDQLIHTEEKLRPRLNATRYKTTQRVTATTQKTTGRPSTSKQSTTPSTVADYYKTTPYQALKNSSSTTPSSASYNGGYGGVSYNASEYLQAVTQDRKVATQYDSSTTKDNRATTTAQDSQASTAGQSSPSGSSAQANRTSDAYADYYKNYYKSQSGSYPNSQTISPYNSSASGGSNAATAESSGKQQATGTDNGITNRVNALLKQAKASWNSSAESHKDPDSSANVYDVSSQPQAFVSDDEPDDDNDYLDQLDISALVRQLIKLETIRKQKQMLRRKKIQRANSKAVANLIVGDLFQGYFKNKKVKSQKALKKHLLHKGRRLIKPKANDSPLPKFT